MNKAPFLKIGITCYPSVGGSGILATELGHELAKLGHEIHFISYQIPFRLNSEMPNVHFHEVEVNEYELFKYPDYTLPLSVKMAEVAMKYDLDILHVHYAVPHAVAAFLAQKMLGGMKPRVITTLHGTDITLIGRDPNYRPIVKYAIEQSCGVTTVSEHLKQDTKKIFKIERDIRVIYNFFTPRSPTKTPTEIRQWLGIKPDETFLLHLSNLRPVKRIPDLLKTVAASEYRDKTKLVILSGGNFMPYQELVEELGLQKNVIVKERVLDIENYLNAADIGVYPSEDESFGLSILETMCYGHPVVSTKAGGIPEVVVDGETGFLAAIGDIPALAHNLDRLIDDPSLREEVGKKGQERARKLFATQKIVNEYLSFYEEILSGNCL